MKKKKTNDLRLYIQGRSRDNTVTWLYVLILSASENSQLIPTEIRPVLNWPVFNSPGTVVGGTG